MNNLETIRGFYETYLQLLPQYKTKRECFEYLNAEVKKINGKKMFLNFEDFEIRTIGNDLGNSFKFTKAYFDLLPYFSTQKECFSYIHELQQIKTNNPLFKGYEDFRQRMLSS